MTHPSGFSLIELLIVAALMSLLITLSAPVLYESISKAQAQAEYVQLSNLIKTARFKAFAQTLPLRLELENQQARLYERPGGRLIFQQSYPHLSFERQQVDFNANGYPLKTMLMVKQGKRLRQLSTRS